MTLWSAGLTFLALACCLITPASAASLESYGHLPAIERVAISADGQYIAIAATNGEQRTVAIERTSDFKIVGGIRVGDTKLRDLQWAGSNHVLITIDVHAALADNVNLGNADHWGGIDYNITTGKQAVMMEYPHALNTIYETPITRVIDGKPYAFLVGELFPEEGGQGELALFRDDLDRGAVSLIEAAQANAEGWVVDARGKPLAEATYDAPSSKWILRVRDGGGWRVVKSLTESIERPYIAGLGRDGASILIGDRVNDEPVLRELAPTAADWGDPIHVGSAGTISDPATERLIGLVSLDGDDRHYTFFDSSDQLAWRASAAAYRGERVSYIGASSDRRKMVVYVDSPTDGPAYAFVDLDARSARWIAAEYTDLKPQDIGEVRPISFKAADGLELSGYLTLPHGKAAKALPLVVFPHGGPAARDGPGFDWWAQAMASRGYAVLQVNYRGSSGYGWKLLSAGFGQWGRKMQTDLSDGVSYLAAQGTIDPKRVCIVGASYGGYAALAGAAIDRGVYRCAASVAGPSDLRKMVARDKAQGRSQGVGTERYWTRYMGAESADDPKLQEISPVAFADKVDIPVLLIHGNQDTVVNYEQSQTMAEALKRAGKDVTFVTLKSEDHHLSRGETRLQMLKAVVEFLEKNNPPT